MSLFHFDFGKLAIFAIFVDSAGHEIWKMSHFGLCAKNGKWAIFAIFVDQSGHEIWQISHFDPWWSSSESSESVSESSDRFLKSGLLGILATARDNISCLLMMFDDIWSYLKQNVWRYLMTFDDFLMHHTFSAILDNWIKIHFRSFLHIKQLILDPFWNVENIIWKNDPFELLTSKILQKEDQ